MLGFACDPPIPVVQFVLWIYKMKMIYVGLNVGRVGAPNQFSKEGA